MTIGIECIRPGQRVETGGNHQLQIALGEHHVGILPVEHFTLLGNPNLTLKCAEWLREDGAMRRAAAAADRAAAAVKEPQFHIAFSRYLMQRPMRAEDLPGAGQHAAVFVGVGVAQHHLLTAAPRGDQAFVLRAAPQLTADCWGVLEIFNRFEEWYWHEAGVWILAANLTR